MKNWFNHLSNCYFILLLGSPFLPSGLFCQATNWDGGGDNVSWHDPLNWDFDLVPTKNLHVIINATGNVIVDNSVDTAFASSLDIQSAGKFIIDPGAILCIDGSNAVFMEDGLRINGSLNSAVNNGLLIVKNAKEHGIWVGSTHFKNTGTILISSYANNGIHFSGFNSSFGSDILNEGEIKIRNTNSGQNRDGLYNVGSFVNSTGAMIEIDNIQGLASEGIFNSDIFFNSGTIIIDSIGNSYGYSNSGSADFKNFGTITVTNTGKAEVFNQAGSKLSGNGIINGSVQNKAILNPGTSIGQFTINGDLEMLSQSKFLLEIEGDAGPGVTGGHDQIVVNGDVILSDTLEVQLSGGFIPDAYRNYSFIQHSGTLSGSFLINVIKPPSLSEWLWYTHPGHVLFRKFCQGNDLIENCTDPSCTLWSGIFQTDNSIQYTGPFLVPSGENVLFRSQETEILNGFQVDQGAVFEIDPGMCGT